MTKKSSHTEYEITISIVANDSQRRAIKREMRKFGLIHGTPRDATKAARGLSLLPGVETTSVDFVWTERVGVWHKGRKIIFK